MRQDTWALVVGGGPVGLVAALRLAEHGIPFTLCESAPELAEDLRASTFHPPTLDMLASLGLSDGLLAQGLQCPSWQVRIHETHERAEFDLGLLAGETAHPFRLQCEQFRLCRLALERLRKSGADVRLGTRVTGLSQDEQRVVARLEDEQGSTELRARWVIGADGARSTVRELVDPEFPGQPYPETTILATTTFPFEAHLPGLSRVNYVWWQGGTFSLLRLPSLWRCSLYPDAGEPVEQALRPASIAGKFRRIVPEAADWPVGEVRPYRIHMRLAQRWRSGRILLAGDAAHLNSPSGGMGMNGGIHDAFALTRALGEVHRGADPALLDEYATVRRRIVEQEILQQADANRARMQEHDPEQRRRLFAGLKATATDPGRARDYLLRSSMISGLRSAGADFHV